VWLWLDGRLTPGDSFREVIAEKVTDAQLILLLVSENFLASRFSYEEELRRALAKQQGGTAKVVPIILNKCDWKNSWFAGFQVLPSNARPLEEWRNIHEGLLNIAQGITVAVRELAEKISEPDPDFLLFSVEELLEMKANIERAISVIRKAIAAFPVPNSTQLIELDQLEQRRERYQTELLKRGHSR
ncbi:MAG: TIR domain-containing protein, partial [Candidatus Electrothrix sp. AR3]|nr:TIR domain-containing protein [Candidatus Electrothrix sp. AR3]